MKKKELHHTPVREYSHAWGEPARSRQTLPENSLANRAAGSEDFPLAQLSNTESRVKKSGIRHFFSLTRGDKRDQDFDQVPTENDYPATAGDLESRLHSLQNLLSDYHWTAETEIIDRTSDAVVHLDQLANKYRASVRSELEKFRDETGNTSLLRRSLVDSALRRLTDIDQKHHTLPSDSNQTSPEQKPPVFFNYFPRSVNQDRPK